MRILIVTHGFPPKEVTGTEQHSYILARELMKNHEVHVFSRGEGKECQEHVESHDKIPISRINTPKMSSRIKFQDTYLDNHVAEIFSARLEEFRPDVIHVQHCIALGFSLLETAIKRNIPILLFLHDFFFMCHNINLIKSDGERCTGPKNEKYCMQCISTYGPSLNKIDSQEIGIKKYQYVNEILCKIDCIASPSQFVKEVFVRNFPSISEIIVAPLGLDLSFLKKFARKKTGKFIFGYLGAVGPHKGVHVLIEAFKNLKMKNVELRIHGGGEVKYQEEIQQIANKDIIFFGPYLHDRLAEILSEIDVLVLPSLCNESYSFTIREALAAGIPVITSNLRSQADAIKEEHNGLHYENENTSDLKIKMELIVKDKQLYQKLSENAIRTHITSIHEQVKQLEDLYHKISH
ncbi:glycosyltransferase family 4 protein [Thermoproteota archaeon]